MKLLRSAGNEVDVSRADVNRMGLVPIRHTRSQKKTDWRSAAVSLSLQVGSVGTVDAPTGRTGTTVLLAYLHIPAGEGKNAAKPQILCAVFMPAYNQVMIGLSQQDEKCSYDQ